VKESTKLKWGTNMIETILAVAGLVLLIALLIGCLCILAHACFGNGGSIWNYILFGRDGMELCFKGIGWCLYGIAVLIAESSQS